MVSSWFPRPCAEPHGSHPRPATRLKVDPTHPAGLLLLLLPPLMPRPRPSSRLVRQSSTPSIAAELTLSLSSPRISGGTFSTRVYHFPVCFIVLLWKWTRHSRLVPLTNLQGDKETDEGGSGPSLCLNGHVLTRWGVCNVGHEDSRGVPLWPTNTSHRTHAGPGSRLHRLLPGVPPPQGPAASPTSRGALSKS